MLVTGSLHSGKKTMCKVLVNYAVKLGWQPTYVDLDLKSDEFTPPGSISASVVSQPMPCDLVQQTMSYFHSSQKIVTQEFFKQ